MFNIQITPNHLLQLNINSRQIDRQIDRAGGGPIKPLYKIRHLVIAEIIKLVVFSSPTSPSARFRSKSFFFALCSWIFASIRAMDSLVNGRNVGRSSSVCQEYKLTVSTSSKQIGRNVSETLRMRSGASDKYPLIQRARFIHTKRKGSSQNNTLP